MGRLQDPVQVDSASAVFVSIKRLKGLIDCDCASDRVSCFKLVLRKDITACHRLGYNSRNLSIRDFSGDTQDFLYGRVKAAIFSHWSRAKGKGKREAWP